MSSKRAETASVPGWSRSMAARLALFYATAAFGLLLIVTASQFWVLQRSLRDDAAAALGREIVELSDLLREPLGNASMLALEVNPHRENSSLPITTYLRVWRANGEVAVETQGMPERLPRQLFTAAHSDAAPRQVRGRDGRTYLLLSAQHVDDSEFGIDAAMDLSVDSELIGRYRTAMFAVLVLGLIASAGGAVWLTRRGLRPLYDITGVVRRIGVDRLHERVDAGRWPMELAELALAFDQMLDRLEAPVARLQQFAADLAHELRTPINALIGETEVALSKPRSGEDYRRVLESNLEEHGRLARLVDNLLFLARSENARAQLVRSRVDVRSELAAVAAFYDAVAQESGVAVDCDGEAWAEVDPLLLRRAISNLLSNALRYTPTGGHVRIGCAGSADGVTITVADDGVGIPHDALPHVFERFYRADGARQRHDGGAGLGLAIVESIVALHGGRVTIDSAPGAGTCVTMWFPASPPDAT
jgi:two-component system, OmpR family, heavy metal sensor histidine kinase CusS